MRFCVGDPFLKCISKITGAKIKLEESVRAGDLIYNLAPHSKDVSGKSVPDYVLWDLMYEGIKLLILEAKTDKSIGMDSVCQTIGYYMASKIEPEVSNNRIPTLALVMSQTKAYLLFFPYVTEGCACVDAVMMGEISLTLSSIASIITFVVKYIKGLKSSCKCITDSQLDLHKKTDYSKFVLTVKEELESELDRLERERDQEREKREQLERERDQEREKREQLERERDQLGQERDQLGQERDQERRVMAETLGITIDQLHEILSLPPPTKRTKTRL